MLDSNLGRLGFRIGFYVACMSGILLFFLEPGTAEHSVTLLTFIIGATFLLTIVVLVRFSTRRDDDE